VAGLGVAELLDFHRELVDGTNEGTNVGPGLGELLALAERLLLSLALAARSRASSSLFPPRSLMR
jgi:hypothetical protein